MFKRFFQQTCVYIQLAKVKSSKVKGFRSLRNNIMGAISLSESRESTACYSPGNEYHSFSAIFKCVRLRNRNMIKVMKSDKSMNEFIYHAKFILHIHTNLSSLNLQLSKRGQRPIRRPNKGKIRSEGAF